MSSAGGLRQTPLTCSGHTRPVVYLAFSELNDDGSYYSVAACKGMYADVYLKCTDVKWELSGPKTSKSGLLETKSKISISIANTFPFFL